jgi:tetratricopeptide (TPR) repeat protein
MKNFIILMVLFLAGCQKLELPKILNITENNQSSKSLEDINEIAEQLANDPNNLKLKIAAAKFHFKHENHPAFIDIYQQVLNSDQYNFEQDISMHNFYAKSLILTHKTKVAEDILKQILFIDAKNEFANSNLGLLYTLLNRYIPAKKYQNIALNLNSNSPIILNNSGILAMHLGNYKQALEWFESAYYLSNNKDKKKVLSNLLQALTMNYEIIKVDLLLQKHYSSEQQSIIKKQLDLLTKKGYNPKILEYK